MTGRTGIDLKLSITFVDPVNQQESTKGLACYIDLPSSCKYFLIGSSFCLLSIVYRLLSIVSYTQLVLNIMNNVMKVTIVTMILRVWLIEVIVFIRYVFCCYSTFDNDSSQVGLQNSIVKFEILKLIRTMQLRSLTLLLKGKKQQELRFLLFRF